MPRAEGDAADGPPAAARAVGWFAAVLAAVVAVGLGRYALQPVRELEDPGRSLQQLDLLYLDEPAPLANRLDLPDGRRALVLVCERCAAPELGGADVALMRSDDPRVASAYGLLTDDGRVGPGYVLVDSSGRLRYRTFDPAPSAHGEEIRTLLEGVP